MAERLSFVLKRQRDKEKTLTLRGVDQNLIYNDTGGTPSYVDPTAKVTSVNGIQNAVTIAGAGLVVLTSSGQTITLTVNESTHAPKHLHVFNEDKSKECNGSKTTFITANEFEPNTLVVYKNGLLLRPSTALDFYEGSFYDSFVLTAAPGSTATLAYGYLGRLGVA